MVEPEVVTVKLEVRPELKQTVTASGEVRPIQYIKLTSEVAGRIEEIYVQPGDLVTKGKPLVRLDPTQLQSSQEAQWAATQASINDVQNARNAVSSAQQSLIVAEASFRATRNASNASFALEKRRPSNASEARPIIPCINCRLSVRGCGRVRKNSEPTMALSRRGPNR